MEINIKSHIRMIHPTKQSIKITSERNNTKYVLRVVPKSARRNKHLLPIDF